MRVLGFLVLYLARLLATVGRIFDRGAFVMNGLLPALLPPHHLTNLIRRHYERSYSNAYAPLSDDLSQWTLEQWEKEVFIRLGIRSGRMLVLGSGVGREAIALANLGLSVIGLDINREALRTAARAARHTTAAAVFVQADFLSLPIRPQSVECLLLSGIMYSSIPGRDNRRAWLRSATDHLTPDGFIVLNFLVDRWPPARSRRLVEALNRIVAALPGANQAYQPGDTCAQSHFLHAFLTEEEIRQELVQTGVTLVDLNWNRGYAVVKGAP